MSIVDLYNKRMAQPWTGGYVKKFIEMLDNDIQYLQNDAYELVKVEQLNKDANSYLSMFKDIPEAIKTRLKTMRTLTTQTLQKRGEGSTSKEPVYRQMVSNYSETAMNLISEVDSLLAQNDIEQLKNKLPELTELMNKGTSLIDAVSNIGQDMKYYSQMRTDMGFLKIRYNKILKLTKAAPEQQPMPLPPNLEDPNWPWQGQNQQSVPPRAEWGANETGVM